MQVDKYPYKKILYLNWHEAAIGHLLLFKYYVDKYTHNVYFLICQQGIVLKTTNLEYMRKVQDQITKFFTAKIQELQISGSADFYDNLIQDIKEQTDKLKDQRDCPYINLVYSEKLRNSCLAMKKHGYSKPYQNWECLERERKGFCFLIVRPEHRWKQIASNVCELARKRYPTHPTQATQITWPIQISYQKFIWFYLKQSFKNFKKSLQIKQNKAQKGLTIIIKNDLPQFNDFQKQIQSLTFSYRPRRPHILQQNTQNKIIILSTLDIQRITQLVYHQFGLTNFAKELRRKMSGFLVISSIDISDQLEDVEQRDTTEKRMFDLREKEDIVFLGVKKMYTVLNRMGRRHSVVNFDGANFVQLKIDKPVRENYQKILRLRLPSLPRYFYWHENEKNYFLLRSYIPQKLGLAFEKSKIFDQISLLYSLICIVEQLHQRNITIGSAMNDCIFLDQKRLIIEPDENGSIQQDTDRLKRLVEDLIQKIKQEDIRHQIKSVLGEAGMSPFGIVQYLEDFIDSNS